MLDVAAALDDPKESVEATLTQQLWQPMFFLGLAQAQFAPHLLADVEKAGIIEVLLPRDPGRTGPPLLTSLQLLAG
jgi:hypothetical protein